MMVDQVIEPAWPIYDTPAGTPVRARQLPGRPGRVSAALAPIALVAGFIARGFDGAAGQACAALLFAALAAIVVVEIDLPAAFWRRLWPPFALVLLGLAWALAVGWWPIGVLPDYALGRALAQAAALAALLAGAVLGGSAMARERVVDWLAILLTLVTVAGLALFWSGTDALFGTSVMRDGRFTGLVGNANVTATISAAVALWAAYRLDLHQRLTRRRWLTRRIGFGSVLVVNLLTVSLAASRLVFIVLALALIGAAIVAARRAQRGRRRGRGAWAVALAVVLGVSLFAGPLSRRFDTLGDAWSLRVEMWGHYAVLAGARPLTGYGLGAFPMVNEQSLTDPAFASAVWAVNSPHNLLLQWLIEGGVPLALAMLAATGLIALPIGRGMAGRWIAADTALLGMIGVVVASAMIDLALDLSAVAALTLFLAGLLWGRATLREIIRIAAPIDKPARHERPIGG